VVPISILYIYGRSSKNRMKSNILNKRGKKTQKEIKYVFNKYKIWIKL